MHANKSHPPVASRWHVKRMGLMIAAGIVFAASAAPVVQNVQAEQPLADQSLHEVVDELASSLERFFLDPSTGRRYAQELRRQHATGGYRGLPPASLGLRVTADLQKIHPDGHLRLSPPSTRPVLGAPSASIAEIESAETGIEKSGWIALGVAYIGFEQFPASKGSLTALRRFLEDHALARTLIIDARTHGGGYTDEVDLLAAYIFDRPTELIYEDTREAAFRPKPDTATLKQIAGPKGFVRQVHVAAPNAIASNLREAKIYVLTSGYTGSAAEHLTLALKRTGRATVIGETTAGMGHFGRMIELPAGFSAFIPIGRPSDPTTGIGWEGIGIKPHFEVPARKALETVLLRLGFASEQAQALGKKWMPRGDMERVIPLRVTPL